MGQLNPTRRPLASEAARLAAPQIRNTKAELLDTITSQHKTILLQTRMVGMVSQAQDLKVARLKMIILLRRQLERRLWDSLLELLAFEERERSAGGHGYTRRDMAPILAIRELFK